MYGYWQQAVFKPTYTRAAKQTVAHEWAVKIQHLGRRETFALHTANNTAAATKAKDIYTMLVGMGWEATLAKFKPEAQRKPVSTVGDFLAELDTHWPGKPKTFGDYCRSLRTILSQAFQIDGGNGKFDYVNGGRDAWVAKLDSILLADVTPEKINKWKIAFVKETGTNPVKLRRARISCNSIMRQAKSLFSPELLVNMGTNKPEKSPFDGVKFYPRESMRYRSTVDIEALIGDALRELPQEQLKIFLLATWAGLRRNEIDKLPWSAFRWNQGVVRIETTEHFTPKTSESSDDVPLDKELLAMFRGWRAKATGAFVIEASGEPLTGTSYTHYRAQHHFDALIAWLKGKGVSARKPLHELRKECGSQICAKHGIHAASRLLRHADISLTAAHYADQMRRVTFGMGDLLKAPPNVVPIDTEIVKAGRSVKGKRGGK